MPQTKYILIRNKMIIDYVVKYVQENNKDRKEVAPLNHMRLYKQMILPCELLGLMGREETHGYKNELAPSYLK